MKTDRFLTRFWNDQSGGAAEAAVILALIGSALATSVILLGDSLTGAVNEFASYMNGTTRP